MTSSATAPSVSACDEARRLVHLSLPVALTQIGFMMLAVVDGILLGRYDTHQMAAASLGNQWVSMTRLVGLGAVLGMDPFVSQAHGARDAEKAGLALQRGLIVALLVSIPTIVLWLFARDFLLFIGQDATLVEDAHRYVLTQIPAAPAFYLFMALRAYLQCRGILMPVLWLIVGANVLNAFLDWALIYGRLGAPSLGIVGAGIATAAVQILQLVVLALAIVGFRLHAGAWTGWKREALSPHGLVELLRVGIPVSVQLALEIWAFAFATFAAGHLGKDALAGHTIVLQLSSLSFMVPLGISIGTVTRVGMLIGAGDRRGAQRAAWVSLALGGGVMLSAAALFVLLRDHLPRLYTESTPVIAIAAQILPIAAAFQFFDGLQVVGGGILRGMGRTKPAAVFHFIGFYVLALPLACWLTLGLGAGLSGIWWGLCLGLAAVAVSFLVWIAKRGPGRAG